jgi:hypothetical protein
MVGDTIKYGRGDVPRLIDEARAAGRREGLEAAAHHFRAILVNGVACRELWDLGQERTRSFGPGLNAIVSEATHGLELLTQPTPKKPVECTCDIIVRNALLDESCPVHTKPAPKPCQTCGGVGAVAATSRSGPLWVSCPDCVGRR